VRVVRQCRLVAERIQVTFSEIEAARRIGFESGTVLVVPPPALCTDNGAMIAWAGAERLALGLTDSLDTAPRARWPLDEVSKPAEQMSFFSRLQTGDGAKAEP
jgi:tRNA A37 threonylcarbamoyltransferase TsaD